VTLSVTRPDGSSESESGEISAQGTFAFDLEINARGEWIFTVSWAGNDEYAGASTDEHTLEVVRTIGKAIIVHGGGDSSENDTFEALNTLADHVYEVFAQRRFTDDDIYYLSPEQQEPKADAVTSLNAMEHAVTTWAPGNLTSDLSLYICVLTHNRPEQGLAIEKQNGTEVLLTAETLDGWLDQIQGNFKDITVVIEASYSEEFIDTLRGPGRVIITSSQRDSRAVVMQNISFSKYLFDNVYGNKNLRDAFQEARSELALRKRLFGNQTPQLDADGDGVTNEDEDMSALESKYIDGNYESEGSPAELPEVIQVCEDQELNEGENEAAIWAIVSSTSEISRVWGTIVPPDFAESTSETESFLSDANLLTIDLKFGENDKYEAVLEGLDKAGIYTLLIYAENAEGVSIPMITLITVPEKQAVDADGKLATAWGDMKNSDATEAVPSRSGMGQNYPNPFNPETWIPYQLRKAAHVEVRIYAPSGKLVRMLELGHKMAGFYVDKQKAAYWDGRNQTGEPVASGVYFYSIHAGDFAAVRKLIVVR